MQSVDSIYLQALNHGYEILGNHTTIAEWSFNNIFATRVFNEDDLSNNDWNYTKDYFPPSSVTSGFRPSSGIFYGLTDEARTASPNKTDSQRYYSAAPLPSGVIDTGLSVQDLSTPPPPTYIYYQYWMSPEISSMGDPTDPAGQYPIAKAQVSVVYTDDSTPAVDTYVNSNKIRATFNLGPKPVTWQIYVFPTGATDWVLAATNPTVDSATGKCELWWNGSAWQTTPQTSDSVYQSIKGITVVINTIDTPGERISLTEIAAMREIDITHRVESWSYDHIVNNVDFIHPVGVIAASSGTINISNSDLQINEDDKTSNFHGLLSGWCEYRSYINFDLSQYAGTTHSVTYQVSTLYGNDFQQQDEYTYQIQVFDIFKRLQVTPCPPLLFINESLGSIISQILDNLGIGIYSFSKTAFNTAANVEYFWTDGTQYAYDALAGLCQAQQASIWQNELGVIVGMSRDDIANDTDAAVWTFKGISDGTRVADFSGFAKKYSLQANDVLVQYKQMTSNAPNKALANSTTVHNNIITTGHPALQGVTSSIRNNVIIGAGPVDVIGSSSSSTDVNILTQSNINQEDRSQTGLTSQLYQTSDTIALRASALVRDELSSTEITSPTYPDNKDVWISSTDAVSWPYAGKVNIDGEYISYVGKGYGAWTYSQSTGAWSYWEYPVKSLTDQQALDQQTWDSFAQNYNVFRDGTTVQDVASGGVSTDPTKQNGYTGRLIVGQRDINGNNSAPHHSINWQDGWMGLNGWWNAPVSPAFKFFEGSGLGVNAYDNLTHIQDWRNKPSWHNAQFKWTWKNSILTCDNRTDGGDPRFHSTLFATCVRDMGDTEYRELGTRMRFNQDQACGGIVFYLSNATGYDAVNPPSTDPTVANRCYILYISTTALCNAGGRTTNEIAMAVKNGNNLTVLPSLNYFQPLTQNNVATPGKYEIDAGIWYDVDLVFYEHFDANGNVTNANVDVMINGAWVNSFITTDVIRPTSLSGVFGRYSCTVDFEYFYGTNNNTHSRAKLLDDELFNFETVQLPAGTNVHKIINIGGHSDWEGDGVLSLSTTNTNATFSSCKLINSNKSKVQEIGPFTILADTKPWTFINDTVFDAVMVEVTYTSTNDVSLCVEYSKKIDFPYDVTYNTSTDNSYYNGLNGYSSTKVNDILLNLDTYDHFSENELENLPPVEIFYDDFGGMVHEVRDFDVPFDLSPAEGTRVYCSNNNVKIVDFKYNPMRGQCTLVNTSHQNEIANGTQQLDLNNSVDNTFLFYGYALVDNGQRNKEIKDIASIRKHGPIQLTFDATKWVFNDSDAAALGQWIIKHWSEPMDTIQIEAFANAFIQLGDKVTLDYSRGDVNIAWLFFITEIQRSMDDKTFTAILTLQRVR